MVTMCMRCQEPFNALTRRRHHCRACGYVSTLAGAGDGTQDLPLPTPFLPPAAQQPWPTLAWADTLGVSIALAVPACDAVCDFPASQMGGGLREVNRPAEVSFSDPPVHLPFSLLFSRLQAQC